MINQIFKTIFLLHLPLVLLGQKEDYQWLFGFATLDEISDSISQDTTWGSSTIDFNFNPPKVYYVPNRFLDFDESNISVCDKNGELLFYSNGQVIIAGDDSVIEDTINHSVFWEINRDVVEGRVITNGMPWIQSSLALSFPSDSSLYYLFYQNFSVDELFTTNIQYTLIDLDGTNNLPEVVLRDQSILQDSLSQSGMTACKHANGRDWWLVVPSVNGNTWHVFYISPWGIEYNGKESFSSNFERITGQAAFSPDGNWFISNSYSNLGHDGGRVDIFQFDRCQGNLEHIGRDTIDTNGFSNGAAISLNSRFAYASNDLNVYQYDLLSSEPIQSRIVVAEYDGYEYFYPPNFIMGWPTYLGFMNLAPDGKIYLASGSGGNRKMHVIHYPNFINIDCDLRQHSLHIPTSYARTMPNIPHWRLGPLDGSPCDTLGIDNIPVAKFRCDQDSLDEFVFQFYDLSYFDPQEWTWTINGQVFYDQHPVYDFQKEGIYTVCLEVSNNNGFDSTCKNINLGVSSTSDQSEEIPLTLYPNPVHDILTVSLHDYYPVNASFELFNLEGKLLLSQPFFSTWNSYNLSSLNEGTYIYRITEGHEILRSGKVLKI